MTVYATPDRNAAGVRVIRAAGGLMCIKCRLVPGDDVDHAHFRAEGIPAMLDHLDFHTVLGDYVPPEAFVRLRAEYADLFERGAL
ncbi:hypothetical protein [Rhodococcus jostii]|uniref:hypothetical protein n=1 Tax=Rhodococcus jostii TaxID=132919 RepID=UPI0036427E79